MLLRRFGKDKHAFVLKVPGWIEVEKTCDAGLGVIAQRLAPLVNLLEAPEEQRKAYPGGMLGLVTAGHVGSARILDLRAPIEWGLIGGGMLTTHAGALVDAVFDEAVAQGESPMLLFGRLAFEIVAQGLVGLKDEPISGEGTATGPAKARRRSPTAKPAR